MKPKKFASQIDEKVLKDLKSYTKGTGRSISHLALDSISEYLQKFKVRPVFKNAMNEVLDDHEELLKRLAK